MREAIAAFISAQINTSVDVVGLQRITVGHSRAMYRVDCSDSRRYVLRLEQGGVFGTSSGEEFGVMEGLHNAGVLVAKVRWMEPTGSVLGFPFFVMDFIDGDEVPDERNVDVDTTAEFVRVLQGVHSLDYQTLALPFHMVPGDAASATHLQIERWAGFYRVAAPEPIPLLEEAAAWLHLNAPPLEHMCVVHGDAGPGNFIHAGGHVVAITDWEFAHLGDPAEDWVYCASMRGSRTMDRQGWVRAFAVVGVELSPSQWSYWEAFNLFKGACANRTCLTLFQGGVNQAPNMAIIGTALHHVFLRRLTDLVQH